MKCLVVLILALVVCEAQDNDENVTSTQENKGDPDRDAAQLLAIERAPYIARLMVGVIGQPQFEICTATIITDRHLLTAAHCYNPSEGHNLYVVVGSDSLDNERQAYDIDNFYGHEDYDHDNISAGFDIAVVVLSQPLLFTETVHGIAIAPYDDHKVPDGVECLEIGFGNTGERSPTDVLLVLPVPYVAQERCLQFWPTLKPTQICAGQGDLRGVIDGDSGGPLVYKDMVLGVLSFGVDDDESKDVRSPSVYTRVSSFREWVQNKVQNIRLPSLWADDGEE